MARARTGLGLQRVGLYVYALLRGRPLRELCVYVLYELCVLAALSQMMPSTRYSTQNQGRLITNAVSMSQ
jgi:hypothetical protein